MCHQKSHAQPEHQGKSVEFRKEIPPLTFGERSTTIAKELTVDYTYG